MQEMEFGSAEIRLESVPHVRIRPVVSPEYTHYRLVVRAYGRRDPRWLRERKLLLTCGDSMGFPYVRWWQEDEDEVRTLETGGQMMLRTFIERAGARRRAEGAGVPVVAPLVVVVLFRTLAEALVRLHGAGLCYRALTDETVWVDGAGLRFLTTACVGGGGGGGGGGQRDAAVPVGDDGAVGGDDGAGAVGGADVTGGGHLRGGGVDVAGLDGAAVDGSVGGGWGADAGALGAVSRG
ncbi:MAG: hypothetical protein RMK16_08440 [Acidobacteriota bacterium]|nr:hypothetical protein [Acidobacteriota bacterium]